MKDWPCDLSAGSVPDPDAELKCCLGMDLIRGHYAEAAARKKPSGGGTGGLGACFREYAKQARLGGRGGA
ncbi:hypothetical protein MesoLj131a_55090 [Mesorhizobium sp. 131-2-1]|nr:hypothetical protein MesoLj131a_55090 [Mesorhizobium sp. 131-2-1]